MDLGACWQPGVWADGSWVEGAWCPNDVCTPESIGECWEAVWCAGSWVTGAWCPSEVTPVASDGGMRYPRRMLPPVYNDDEEALVLALMETLLNG